MDHWPYESVDPKTLGFFSLVNPRKGSMGLEWYIHLHEWLISYGKLVAKYTIHHGFYGIEKTWSKKHGCYLFSVWMTGF